MESNSVCNHTRDQQIGLPLRRRPIFLLTRVITDRIGLHLVLLLLLIAGTSACVYGPVLSCSRYLCACMETV